MSERSDTPRTEDIVSAGMAEMKAAGLSDAAVYDACAALVKKLAENGLRLEREAEQTRADAAEDVRRLTDDKTRLFQRTIELERELAECKLDAERYR